MTIFEKFKSDLPYIKYDRCKAFFMKLIDILRKNENYRNSKFREAYNLSYTDIYDFASKKQSLKKWEIELDI